MASRRAIGHWLILLLLSVLFSSLLLRIHLPAALLLGPLIAGLILSLRGVKLSIPRPCYLAAQAIVGCMIARAINPSVFGVLFNNWALVLAILLTTLAISGLTGWLLVRYSALPGATGAWGSSPGGASAMVVMAQEYGADVRLVALMQYLRVLFVVGAAALVVRYALGNEAQEMTQDIVWFPSLTLNFPFTLLLTAVACWLGMRLRIPSGAMLLPMLLGALAQGGGWLMLELPEWLLAMAYAVLGWTVGLQFNKAIFLLALKTLPQIIASILGLILMCALMALAFVHPLPICADESCHTRESLPRLRGRYEMVNIKLDKTGGLTEALALAGEAERQGFERMLGCMLCTSRGIAAALPLAPLARFADLDGPTWLAVDVEPALRFSTGVLHL
ncbi:TPA: AbrB family transcriptional regulator [Klebsiella pneumoniae]